MGVYEKLGVRTMINAVGNGTAAGGSIMRPEVFAAMEDASRSFVRLPELLQKAGRRVAELAGVEAAFITAGAAAGVTVAVAACMTGKDDAKVHQLPNTDGMKDEVIIQVMQRNYYELMIRLAGARLIEVGLANRTYPWHIEAAINEQTAAIVHFVAYSPPQDLPVENVIEIAHKHGLPVIVDAAAEFPPFSNLRRYADMGADLTIFSGGKGLRGPQSSGLILGREDLIEACTMHSSPNHGVGRPPKVGKEEIIGLVTALELFASEEFSQAELNSYEERTAYIVEALSHTPGIVAYRETAPPSSFSELSGAAPEGVPLAHVEWEEAIIPKSKEEVRQELAEGSPGIMAAFSPKGISLAPHTMQPGEERIVAERVAQLLSTQE
ncbi:MAG: aminotransferase class V-fold PLP-dependent enzyme [Caldilineaceae bacterium SB0675_bin_29]|uniref:Aminotransferase class V-fold PLP-dependent enzyme n=1 Tax=Caldilineaceae bacterium SB0675_bin_29 TaxID=2605266 RepID=A0A6B1FUQ8_9CHLR|nr:aminotransferase class V-fold PLP-dependent enzyme [Caldilineaceae bacterium SB0675_bin_29]